MIKLYYGGDIITMREEGEYPEALVVENNKILYVGKKEKAINLLRSKSENDFEEIDLEGKTLMPSFIDGHSHFFQTVQGIHMCDLSETESFLDIVSVINEYIEKNNITSEDVILGSGYDHNFLAEGKHPSKYLLDQATAEIPIYISHVSGHMGVANSAMLNLAGLTKDVPNPEGGVYGRTEDGELSGYLEEQPAIFNVIKFAMPRLKVDITNQIKEVINLYLKNGVTTVQEGAGDINSVKGLEKFAESENLNLDVVFYALDDEYNKIHDLMPEYIDKYRNHIKVGGQKIILDGSPQGKTAWLSKPYEDEEEYRGYPTHPDDYVNKVVENSVFNGHQLLAHCNGDAASEQFLKAFEIVAEKIGIEAYKLKDLRPVMIHCQTERKDQVDRMSALNMIPSVFIGHTYYWGDIHLKNLGSDRGNNISPLKWMKDKELIFNFHQDTPVTKPNMLHSVWCAVNRITRKGKIIGEDQCIDVYNALKAITINAAYSYHEEESKGSLEEGKYADMVILSNNPLKVNKKDIKDISVIETIKAGETVYHI